MRLHELRRLIRNKRKNGMSYRSIGIELGISAPEVDRIDHGKNPGPKAAKILDLEPSADLISTRKRNERLDEIARGMGYSSWCAYGTALLKECKNL